MTIILTEQQIEKILSIYEEVIKKVLEQKNINFDDIQIIHSQFPESSLKILVKGMDKERKGEAKMLIKGILSRLSTIGKSQSLSFNE